MVLILGGTAGSGPVASAEWFNTQTLTFSPVGEAMASPREDFGAALLGTGDVLLVGGTADGTVPVATAEIFDPVNITFTPTGSMATPRMGPSVFVLGDGTVMVLGGTAATPVERFTPAS